MTHDENKNQESEKGLLEKALPQSEPIKPAVPGEAANPGKAVLLSVLLFLLVLGLFLPSIKNDFIHYFDDNAYVTENTQVQKGFTWENIRWAFGGINVWFYYPLTLLSHCLDCELFGLKPWGHHLTSVLLHAFNTLLAFVVLRRMTGAIWRSLFVAALFGMHPLRVESVAWVAERKDVLSTFFWLLTLWAYVRYVESRDSKVQLQQLASGSSKSKVFYGLALLFFAMGLLSKPMLVTLPCVLLLLDYWPLNRVTSGKWRNRLLVEKIPFFLLAVAASAITVIAQKSEGAVSSITHLPLIVRLDNSLISYCRYFGKLFAPVKLGLLYPYNQGDWPAWQVFMAASLLLGISVWAAIWLRRRPYMAVGWFWFVGTLVPVIGLVQVGGQAMADRFTYVPSIGLFMLLAWGVHELTQGWRHQRITLGVVAVVLILGCGALTLQQLSYWKNSETLFRHTLAVTEKNPVMHYNLGTALSKDPERLPEAIAQFEAVLRIDPYDANAHIQLGDLLMKTPDRAPEASAHYETALHLNKAGIGVQEDEESRKTAAHAAHYNLGIDEAKAGRLPEAIAHFQEVVRIRPEDADGHINLGIALFKSNRMPEAQAQFEQALLFKPDSALAHYNLGAVLKRDPARVQEAIAHYEEALRVDPNWAQARQALERLRAAPSQP